MSAAAATPVNVPPRPVKSPVKLLPRPVKPLPCCPWLNCTMTSTMTGITILATFHIINDINIVVVTVVVVMVSVNKNVTRTKYSERYDVESLPNHAIFLFYPYVALLNPTLFHPFLTLLNPVSPFPILTQHQQYFAISVPYQPYPYSTLIP